MHVEFSCESSFPLMASMLLHRSAPWARPSLPLQCAALRGSRHAAARHAASAALGSRPARRAVARACPCPCVLPVRSPLQRPLPARARFCSIAMVDPLSFSPMPFSAFSQGRRTRSCNQGREKGNGPWGHSACDFHIAVRLEKRPTATCTACDQSCCMRHDCTIP
jgi:hypothetical protein